MAICSNAFLSSVLLEIRNGVSLRLGFSDLSLLLYSEHVYSLLNHTLRLKTSRTTVSEVDPSPLKAIMGEGTSCWARKNLKELD